MKNCPNCGAQNADDSRFCTECGKPIPQGSACPHCGASVNDGDVFCQNCGKKLSEVPKTIEPTEKKCPHCGVSVNEDDTFCQSCGKNLDAPQEEPIQYEEEEEEESVFKKYLPFIIGALLLLVIIGYCSSYGSKRSDDSLTVGVDTATVDSATVDDSTDSEQEIQAKKAFLKEFYDGLEKGGSGDVINMDYIYSHIKKHITANALKVLKDEYDYECDDGDCLAIWLFSHAEGSDAHNMLSYSIEELNENDFVVETKYENADYRVLLTVIKVGDEYKIDNIGEHSQISKMEEEEYYEEDSSYYDNPTAKYVGSWTNYIYSQGTRAKVYTAKIHSDNTADWILYMPDGSVNTSMHFRKCVFQNGYLYLTDNGDISIKGTPRFRLGSNGLQTADGQDMVKE